MFRVSFTCQSKKNQVNGDFKSFSKGLFLFDSFSKARSFARDVIRGFKCPFDSDCLVYSGLIINVSSGVKHVIV